MVLGRGFFFLFSVMAVAVDTCVLSGGVISVR